MTTFDLLGIILDAAIVIIYICYFVIELSRPVYLKIKGIVESISVSDGNTLTRIRYTVDGKERHSNLTGITPISYHEKNRINAYFFEEVKWYRFDESKFNFRHLEENQEYNFIVDPKNHSLIILESDAGEFLRCSIINLLALFIPVVISVAVLSLIFIIIL